MEWTGIFRTYILFLGALFWNDFSLAQSPEAATTPPPKRDATPDLKANMDQALLHNGGAITLINDASSIAVNPASLTNRKIFAVGGSILWKKENIRAYQLSAQDSFMSSIAAAIIYHKTTKITAPKDQKSEDQRIMLGLAERLENGPFSVGLAGDLKMIENGAGPKKDKNVFDLKAGVNYTITEFMQVGVVSGGYFDTTSKPYHGAGFGFGYGGIFTAHADLFVKKSKFAEAIGGFQIPLKEFLDLRMSYKYDRLSKTGAGSAGIALKTDKLALSYVFHKPDLELQDIVHNVGLSLNVAM